MLMDGTALSGVSQAAAATNDEMSTSTSTVTGTNYKIIMKYPAGTVAANSNGLKFGAAGGVVFCAMEVSLPAACQPTVNGSFGSASITMAYAGTKAALDGTNCLGGSIATPYPLTSLACTLGVNKTVNLSGTTSNVFKLGKAVINMTGASANEKSYTTTDCALTAALAFDKQCFAGFGNSYTYALSISVSKDMFKVGSSSCTKTGGTKLLDVVLTCSDKKTCTLTGSDLEAVQSVECDGAVDAAVKVINVSVNSYARSIYESSASLTTNAAAATANNAVSTVQVVYTPSSDNSLWSGLDTKLDALKADVAKIPTTANSSASIVPFFLLGVFGSVFALTM